METVQKDGFKIIGLKVRTTNENQQAANDIGMLWQKFMSESVQENIPNKVDTFILSVYCNYEGNHTKPYDTVLGCVVSSLDIIPEGMVGYEFKGGKYKETTAKGNLAQGVVYNAWLKIWEEDLNRTYHADYEVYGAKAQNPTAAEVTIFVGIQ